MKEFYEDLINHSTEIDNCEDKKWYLRGKNNAFDKETRKEIQKRQKVMSYLERRIR